MTEPTSSQSQAIPFVAAVLLIAVSAAQNITHGFEIGLARSAAHAVIFASGSLGGALLQPYAFLAAFRLFRAREWVRGTVALALGLACFTYAAVSSLGFVATSRNDMAANRAAGAETYQRAKVHFETVERELNSLASARPVGELQPLIDGVLSDPRAENCATINGAFTRTHCPAVAHWKSELARAQRRAELEHAMHDASATMEHMGQRAAREADPQAAALAAYATALGWPLAADQVAPWLCIMAVLFFEIAAASSLVVVQALATTENRGIEVAPKAAELLPPQERAKALRAAPEGRANDVAQPPQDGKASGPTRAMAEILQRLRACGGTLEGSQARIANLLGAPKTSVHRMLHSLAAAGAVQLVTSPHGTRVALNVASSTRRPAP
jgi:hypothetical protein